LAVLLALIAPAALAAVETADFEGLGYTNGQQIPETVSLDGFRFATATHEGMDYMIDAGANDSAGLLSHYSTWVEFRREDNAAFALTSIYFDSTDYPGTAAAGSSVGAKGIHYAAQIFAAVLYDLFTGPNWWKAPGRSSGKRCGSASTATPLTGQLYEGFTNNIPARRKVPSGTFLTSLCHKSSHAFNLL